MSMSEDRYREIVARTLGGTKDEEVEVAELREQIAVCRRSMEDANRAMAAFKKILEQRDEIIKLKTDFAEWQQRRIESLEKSLALSDEICVRLAAMNERRCH